MSDEIAFDSMFALDDQWTAQAEQMSICEEVLRAAPLTGLPSSVSGAATDFMKMWVETATRARVGAEVYADEIREIGVAFEDLEAEIAERLDDLGGVLG